MLAGASSLTTADQTMPTPTSSSSRPSTKDAAFSKRWCPYGWSTSASFWLWWPASSTTKSATRSDSEWMPSATKPCDLASTPTTICVVDSTTLTTTLTHVVREAALARSAGVWVLCSESSSISVKFMGLSVVGARPKVAATQAVDLQHHQVLRARADHGAQRYALVEAYQPPLTLDCQRQQVQVGQVVPLLRDHWPLLGSIGIR